MKFLFGFKGIFIPAEEMEKVYKMILCFNQPFIVKINAILEIVLLVEKGLNVFLKLS